MWDVIFKDNSQKLSLIPHNFGAVGDVIAIYFGVSFFLFFLTVRKKGTSDFIRRFLAIKITPKASLDSEYYLLLEYEKANFEIELFNILNIVQQLCF